MKTIVEICTGSFEDVKNAQAGGADRVELNSGLFLGGLTPSRATMRRVAAELSIPAVAMVRPRGAGFCYTADETAVMLADARLLLENGAAGIAFGFLTPDRRVDEDRTGEMTALIHELGGGAVFHRAFDCTVDPHAAIEALIRLGVDRVLTSGLADKAPDGVALLRELQRQYGGEIQLLAGSGVNAGNARQLMEETGICQLHSSCRHWFADPTTHGGQVSYGYGPDPYGDCYDGVSQENVRNFVQAVKG